MTASLSAGPSRWRTATHLAAFVVIFILAEFLLFALAPTPESRGKELSPGSMLLAEGALFAGVLISTTVMALVERRGIRSYGLGDPHAFARFISGVLAGVVLCSILTGGIAGLGYLRVKPALSGSFDMLTYGCAWATAFFLVAMGEEMLFRGYLQVALSRLIGFWAAAVILSTAFGLVHLSNRQTVPLSIAAAAAVGLVLSLCLRLSGSLWWGIGYHSAWNWAQSFLYGTAIYGDSVEGRLLHSEPIGDPLWSGGGVGPEASRLIVPVLMLTAFIVWLIFRGRDRAVAPPSVWDPVERVLKHSSPAPLEVRSGRTK
jgi:membrane protease YdiL (CAAX protease family)